MSAIRIKTPCHLGRGNEPLEANWKISYHSCREYGRKANECRERVGVEMRVGTRFEVHGRITVAEEDMGRRDAWVDVSFFAGVPATVHDRRRRV